MKLNLYYLLLILFLFTNISAFSNELKCISTSGTMMGLGDDGNFVEGNLTSSDIKLVVKQNEPIQLHDDSNEVKMTFKNKRYSDFTRWVFEDKGILSLNNKTNSEGFREAIYIRFFLSSKLGMTTYYKCYNL